MEIQLDRKRRWRGWIAYLLLFGLICAVLVWFMLYFTPSLPLAVGAVLFMVSWMVLMGWWASRHMERTNRDEF